MRDARLLLGLSLLGGLPACASLLGLNEDYEDRLESASSAGSAGKGPGPTGGTTASSGGNGSNQAGRLGAAADGGGENDGGSSGGEEALSPLTRVIHGQTTLEAGSAERTLTIGAVTPERSLLVFGTSFDSTSSSLTAISGQLTATDTLSFERIGGDNAPSVPVEYYVAEFGSGVTVQRGSVRLEDATTRIDLSRQAPLEHSFPLVTFRNEGSFYGLDDHVRAKLTGPTELTLEMYQASTKGVAEWQVVTFEGARVQAGDLTIAGSALQVKGPLASAIDPARTWLSFSYEVADINESAADLMLRGRVEANQVVLDRAAGGASATVTYYAVSFENGSAVRSGELELPDQSQIGEAALDGIDPARCLAVASGNYSRSGTTSYASANNPGYSSFRFSLTADQLTARRGASAANGGATVSWNVIQFR